MVFREEYRPGGAKSTRRQIDAIFSLLEIPAGLEYKLWQVAERISHVEERSRHSIPPSGLVSRKKESL
jgi:hypothetical protein